MRRFTLLAALLLSSMPGVAAGQPSELEQLMRISPPPALSKRPHGAVAAPCDVGAPTGPDEQEGKTYQCGVFTVPMRWDDPDSPSIDLRYIVARATGPKTEPDPLVYLAGGPGQSAVLTSLAQYSEVRHHRDIVRLDQRGTGLSQRLGLEECLVLALQDPQAAGEVELLAKFVSGGGSTGDSSAASLDDLEFNTRTRQLCARQFSRQGIDLGAFTSAQSARDVVALLEALGYRSFNLHGVSYGTRLAMTLMAMLPGMQGAPELRSVVLDSTVPPSIYLLSSLAHNNHDPLLQLLQDCQRDEACRSAYPNLEPRLAALLDRLAAKPLVVGDQTITVTDVVKELSNLAATRSAFLPKMIGELERGVTATYVALRDRKIGTEQPENASSLDLSDPVQAFLAGAIKLLGKGGELGPVVAFVAASAGPLAQDDPRAALQEYIAGTYEGEQEEQLSRLLAQVSATDFANSPYVAQVRAAHQAQPPAPPTPEEKAERQLRAQRMLTLVNSAYFLNINIHCNEDYAFERYEDALNAVHDLTFPQFADLDYLKGQAETCIGWPVPVAPVEVKNPVASTVPTLILQGAYDNRTPVYMGRRASRELANSTLVIVPQQGHEVWTSPGSCASRIGAAFIADPARAPDLSCLDARRPQWALPD